MPQGYVLAIDEGTTGTTALLIDSRGQVTAKAYREIHTIYPQPGWVEQDPRELLRQAITVAREAIQQSGVSSAQVKGVGITNQRETTVVWERETGNPVSNAIVWQCRRSAPLCDELKQRGLSESIRSKTGLVIDAYFSATKLRWILDHIPDGQRRAEQGELLFGTVDSWLVWNLTGGSVHVTDYSNASRTMLFNIHTLQWDSELLGMLNIPEAVLPKVLPSSHIYGEMQTDIIGKERLPIGGIAGDQQAALFGQACYHPGMAKNTYGTGSFVLVNTGTKAVDSATGLITTIAWGLGGELTYALEGSIFVTGAAIQWLRDGLKIIGSTAESETLAASVPDNGGVYFVPAFTGLGAPYWDMYARGTIVGLTRGVSSGHIARAALEAIAYQVRDVLDVMNAEAGLPITSLRVDGGGTANSLLMQFQSDILDIPVRRAAVPDITALGAGYLAGLAVGLWRNTGEIEQLWQSSAVFAPQLAAPQRDKLYRSWKRAVERSRNWAED